MPDSFDFISAMDHPALLAISTPEWHAIAKAALTELGYKVHSVESHPSFPIRFNQVQYEVVIIEDLFCATEVSENSSLQHLRHLTMSQRRHATVLLLGPSFQTFNAMQAFQLSVHAVINSAELPVLGQLIQKVVADNLLFLQPLREAQERLHQHH
jgi:hypothetical protein